MLVFNDYISWTEGHGAITSAEQGTFIITNFMLFLLLSLSWAKFCPSQSSSHQENLFKHVMFHHVLPHGGGKKKRLYNIMFKKIWNPHGLIWQLMRHGVCVELAWQLEHLYQYKKQNNLPGSSTHSCACPLPPAASYHEVLFWSGLLVWLEGERMWDCKCLIKKNTKNQTFKMQLMLLQSTSLQIWQLL